MHKESSRKGLTAVDKRRILRIVSLVCLLGTLFFIFLNSAQPGQTSQVRSESAERWLGQFLRGLGISPAHFQLVIRKGAHIAEYALLGFWLMAVQRLFGGKGVSKAGWACFGGLLVPVLDECFQLIIPGRSGMVIDVLVDFVGICLGFGVCLLAFRLFRRPLQRWGLPQ